MSNNAVVVPDSTKGVAINGFDIEMADVSGTVLASAEDKKDEISSNGNGKRSGSATDEISNRPDDQYVCNFCKKIFAHDSSLKRHVKKQHGCDLCSLKCDRCDAEFPHKNMLRIHKREIHDDKTPYFMCQICKSTYLSMSTLNRHAKSHSDTTVAECDECGKTFKRKDCLKQHKRTHSGYKPFECKVCHKRLANKRNLAFHQTCFKHGPEYK